MPPFAESQHAIIGFDDENSPVLFVKQTDNGKAGKSIAASGVWDSVTYSEGPSFFGRILDFNFCCSLDNNQVGNNKQVEEVNTDSVVVEQNFTSNMQRYQSRVNREQTIMILQEIQRTKSPIKKAEEAVNHRRREAAEQYVYMKPSDDTTIPTKNESWQLFDTPFSIQHDENNENNFVLLAVSIVRFFTRIFLFIPKGTRADFIWGGVFINYLRTINFYNHISFFFGIINYISSKNQEYEDEEHTVNSFGNGILRSGQERRIRYIYGTS